MFYLALLLVVLYTFVTSEVVMGRRLTKVIAYHCDVRYWPAWYSIILWIATLAMASFAVLRKSSFRLRLHQFIQANAPKPIQKIPSKYYTFLLMMFYLLVLVSVMLYLFLDVKPLLRYLRFKVYAEYFQMPVILYFENGELSFRLLTGPVLILLAILFCYYCKKKGTKLFLVPLLLYPVASSLLMAEFNNDSFQTPNQFSEIEMLEKADYQMDSDLKKVSHTPSEKNPDGGYNANVSILQCFAVMRYFYTGGRYNNEEIRFRMRFPLNEMEGKKYPLIIWLHGFGESTGDNERHLAHLHHAIESFVGKNAFDFYMIAVQCPPDNTTWEKSLSTQNKGDSRLTIVAEIMNQAIKQYPIDEKRIGVIGISSGASATWDFVERNSGRIAGMVPFSGTPKSPLKEDAFQNTSIWAFNNKGDVGASWTKTAQQIKRLNDLGGNGYVTLRDHGIHDTWTYPLRDKDVIKWVVTQSLDGDGLLQDVPYPKRSFLTIFLMFLLPLGCLVLMNVCTTLCSTRTDLSPTQLKNVQDDFT